MNKIFNKVKELRTNQLQNKIGLKKSHIKPSNGRK